MAPRCEIKKNKISSTLIFHPFTSLYPFLSCISLFRTSHVCPALPLLHFLISYFPCLPRTSPPIILSNMPAPADFLSFPSRTSLYCGIYLFSVCAFLLILFYWDFPEKCICTWICFFLLIWLSFIQCCSFCFEIDASAVSVCFNLY